MHNTVYLCEVGHNPNLLPVEECRQKMRGWARSAIFLARILPEIKGELLDYLDLVDHQMPLKRKACTIRL